MCDRPQLLTQSRASPTLQCHPQLDRYAIKTYKADLRHLGAEISSESTAHTPRIEKSLKATIAKKMDAPDITLLESDSHCSPGNQLVTVTSQDRNSSTGHPDHLFKIPTPITISHFGGNDEITNLVRVAWGNSRHGKKIFLIGSSHSALMILNLLIFSKKNIQL